MTFFHVYTKGLLLVTVLFVMVWLISIYRRNAGIVDIFWGTGFIAAAAFYLLNSGDFYLRKIILLAIVVIWGMRLSIYIMWRNLGKEEDFRYQNFRKHYGEHRYWWVSLFQVFLLQGTLLWLISAPLMAAMFFTGDNSLNMFDIAGIILWLTGFVFEAGGDRQLARFRANPKNKGKVLQSGFWKYTRHPNYFGDAAVWWGFGMFSIAAGSWIPALGSVLMTFLIVKVSGVTLLEKSLKTKKQEYRDYIKRTSAFFPWFPKNRNSYE